MCIRDSLGIEAAKLEYEVIEKGSNGFLGIGSKPAIIKAKKNQSVEDIAREFLNKVFTCLLYTSFLVSDSVCPNQVLTEHHLIITQVCH